MAYFYFMLTVCVIPSTENTEPLEFENGTTNTDCSV